MPVENVFIIPENIVSNIIAVKNDLHLTMILIGNATGVSGSTVSTYLTQLRKSNTLWIDKFCEAFHVDKEWLYEGSGDPVYISKPLSFELRKTDGAADRLLQIRRSLNLKQSTMASALGLSRQMYNRIETGNANLTESVAKKVEDVFNVGSEWLLYGDKSKKDYPVSEKMIEFLWENKEERKKIFDLIEKHSDQK